MIYEQIIPTFQALSIVVHNVIFALSFVAIFRIFFVKYTPYSIFYIASILLVQAVYNGCPISDINNFFSYRIGIELDPNEFWGGIFGQYALLVRVITMVFSILLFYVSYKTWDKPAIRVDFGRIFQNQNSSKLIPE